MTNLTSLLVTATQKWWLILIVTILNVASFQILFGLEYRFTHLTDLKVFDTQNDLTAARLLEQLPNYAGAARNAYNAFAAFDFVFLFVVSLFLAVLWALLLRLNKSSFTKHLLSWHLPLARCMVTLFDWLENVSILSVLSLGATALSVNCVLVFKRLKLVTLFSTGFITVILILLTVIYALWNTRKTL